MFVVGRGVHEFVQIGNDIIVKVLRIGDKRVTLGVDAPRAVTLRRGETLAATPRSDVDLPLRPDLRVLVVDPTPIHAWLIQKTLNAYGGFDTQVIPSGKEALRRLGLGDASACPSRFFDLILMELRLPDLCGCEVLRKIRSAEVLRTTPVILLSDWHSQTDVAQSMEAGANAFMPKPDTQEGFREMVRRIADFWSYACHAPVGASRPLPSESLVC